MSNVAQNIKDNIDKNGGSLILPDANVGLDQIQWLLGKLIDGTKVISGKDLTVLEWACSNDPPGI